MESTNEALQASRDAAEKRLGSALSALREAALEIGRKHAIPEGVCGLSIEELLGRMAYVPSMARDLKRATVQALATQNMAELLKAPSPAPAPSAPKAAAKLAAAGAVIPSSLDLANLPGITAAMVKTLKAAGMQSVGDVVGMPDEHLVKITSWDEKQIGKLRTAIGTASKPVGSPE